MGTLVALPDGGAFLVGHSDDWKHAGSVTRSFRFDARSGRWHQVGPASASNQWQGATGRQTPGDDLTGAFAAALPDGRVLVAGGITYTAIGAESWDVTRTARLYDPRMNTWSSLPSMPTGRQGGVTVALADGSVLLIGGDRYSSGGSPTADRFVPTPKPVAGWPSVSQAGVTLTGTVEAWDPAGRLGLSVSVTGLAPHEVVSLEAAGEYDIGWICGTQPEPCGQLGCGPTTWDTTKGTAKAAAQAVAATNGRLAAQVALVAVSPAGSCPTDSGSPWVAKDERWEKVSITDSAHGLVLTPDPIERGFTF
jgi:hypothetical protein